MGMWSREPRWHPPAPRASCWTESPDMAREEVCQKKVRRFNILINEEIGNTVYQRDKNVLDISKCCHTYTILFCGGLHLCIFWHCHGMCERRKTEIFLNVAAGVNSENHLQCLKGYSSNLLETMCERGLFSKDNHLLIIRCGE